MGHNFPVLLNLSEKLCVVVGGGKVAERKVTSLLNCQAKVIVVSPELTSFLEQAKYEGLITVVQRTYISADINDAFIVIVATDNEQLNKRVAEDCAAQNILVNIVDDPENCSFIMPAFLHQGALTIAISTDGKSPLLARTIKEQLEKQFGPEYADFLEIMGNLRESVIKNVNDADTRRQIFNIFVESDIIDLLRCGHMQKVKERINDVLGSSGIKSQDCTCGDT